MPWYLHTERWNSVFWTWSNFGVLVVMAGMLLFFFSKHFVCFLRQSQLNLFHWWIMNWGFQPVTEAVLWNFALCCDTRLFSLRHLSLPKDSSALPSLMHTHLEIHVHDISLFYQGRFQWHLLEKEIQLYIKNEVKYWRAALRLVTEDNNKKWWHYCHLII